MLIGSTHCLACQPGAFQGHEKATICILCPPGSSQSHFGATACLPCDNRTEFSSRGDTECSPCGQPARSLPECPLPSAPANTSGAFWISVTDADGGEGCASTAVVPRIGGDDFIRARFMRLERGAVCRHTLRVLGLAEASQNSTLIHSTHVSGPRWSALRVFPYNRTFFPALCELEGFKVLFVVPDPSLEAFLEVWDPLGRHLLYRASCELEVGGHGVNVCLTRTFCPTMDVLVRVSIPGGSFDSTALDAETRVDCPPVQEWRVSVELEGPHMPRFPGDSLTFAVRLLNQPDRLQAFKLQIRILPGFTFVSFDTGAPHVQELGDDKLLTVRADTSDSVIVGGLLGKLVVWVNAFETGSLVALHIAPDGLQVLVGSVTHWLGVPHTCPIHQGRVAVPVDHLRCTGLVVRARRDWLVHWQAVQDRARISSTEIDVLGIWNTRDLPSPVEALCRSLTPRILEVQSCRHVQPRGAGVGRIHVRFQEQEATVSVRVLQPRNPHARVFLDGSGRPGRLQVLARLFGRILDVTPFVLPDRDEWEPVCPPGFLGNMSVGAPALVQVECLQTRQSPEKPLLFLLPRDGWAPGGLYRISSPSMDSGEVWPLALRGGGLLPFEGPLVSTDPDRMIVVGGNRLALVRRGYSSRCVDLGDSVWQWKIPVVPPPPVSLDLRLTTRILVVQQDLLKLVPSEADVRTGRLVFADGGSVDVASELTLFTKDTDVLAVREHGFDSLFKPGIGQITLDLPGLSCIGISLPVTVHVSSVESGRLVCPKCRHLLSVSTDPLAERWPDKYLARIPEDWFVVVRQLVDGTTHEQREPLQISGGVLQDGLVMAQDAGKLKVTTGFTSNEIIIPVVRRWAVNWTLLCNGRTCDANTLKLAPEGDGAGRTPFGYATRLRLKVELVLCTGFVLWSDNLPGVSLNVNGVPTPFGEVSLIPGSLVLSVRFDPCWEMVRPDMEFRLWVHALESLRLIVAPKLLQLHCSRRWGESPVSLRAVLSDGREEEVTGDLTAAGMVFLSLDNSSSSTVHAHGPGMGLISASFASHTVTEHVIVAMESLLFTDLSLDGLPEEWSGSVGERRRMHVMLRPSHGLAPGLLDRVVRWRTEPSGIIDVAPGGELILLSDHYEPVVVSGVIRSCQGAPPLVFRRPIQINVVPDQAWQVDLGQEAGIPVPGVPIGDHLSVSIFVLCPTPLLEFNGSVSMPGIDDVSCLPGELPFSECTVDDAWILRLSGKFLASQRVGRLHLGSLRGRVLLDGLARLRVSLSSPGGTATHEFTVRLGLGAVYSLLPRPNAVVQGLVAHETSVGWRVANITGVAVCCNVLASRLGSRIAHLVPSSFEIQNVTLLPTREVLRLDDARLQVLFDDLVLSFSMGRWTVQQLAPIVGVQTSRIKVRFQNPWQAALSLEAGVTVTLAKQDSLVFEPADHLLLRRLHCSDFFESLAVRVSLQLDSGERIQLKGSDLYSAAVEDPAVASVRRELTHLEVQGMALGETALRFNAFGLSARLPVHVLNESIVLRSASMPDPYVLESAAGDPQKLIFSGVLGDGRQLADAGPLVSVVTADGGVVEWNMSSLIARRNTHPAYEYSMVATVPACGDAPGIIVSSRLLVRLRAHLDHSRPVDVAITAEQDGFELILVAERVSAFLIHLRYPVENLLTCSDGPDLPVLADCVAEAGSLTLAGAFGAPRKAPVRLTRISPMPARVCGHVEFFSGVSSTSLPILAGCVGNVTGTVPVSLPAADPATLARQYAAALERPWDHRAMREVRFTLELLTGRQRLVDARLYSNEFELSAMFGVTDRFLVPDENKTFIDVVFHSSLLPPHPKGMDVPDGIRVRAEHFVDGWYVVQWVEAIPRLSVFVSYQVSTVLSETPWQHDIPEPLVTGRPLHECPRLAMDRASFLVVYKIPGPLPADRADVNFACAAQVAPRRVVVLGPDSQGLVSMSVALESFARIHQAQNAITDHLSRLSGGGRRLLQAPEVLLAGVTFINDTADPFVPCPPGTYYTENGTYAKLPLHGLAGPDCHGVACVDGFRLLEGECAPATVPINLVWVCVSAILAFVLLISCVLCALHMGRRLPVPQPAVDLVSESWHGSNHAPDMFDDDVGEFQNIVLGSYLDDYSQSVLLDEDTKPEMGVRQSCC